MKKLYTLILACVSSVGLVFGQGLNLPCVETTLAGPSTNVKNNTQTIFACDTLLQYENRATAFSVLSASGGGYVGLSNIHVTETGQHFTNVGATTVSKVLFVSGLASSIKQIGTADVHTAYLYLASAVDNLPTGPAVGSATFTTSSILPFPAYNAVTFATPVPVTGNFVATLTGLDAVGKDDTIPLVFNGAGNGAGERRAMQKLSSAFGGLWDYSDSIWTSFNRDALIIPIINCATGIDSYATSNGLTLKGTYPNPASEYTNITYSIKEPSIVSIKVFEVTGRVIQESSTKLNAGEQTMKVDLKDLAPGTYYYTIKTNKTQLTSEFLVVK